jgi:Tol biopolymer transport system component
VLLYRVGESIAPVATSTANERSPVLSPDGKWIAFVSDATGRDEVFVKRLDAAREPTQLTESGGTEPAWFSEGLLYRSGDRVVLAKVSGEVLSPPEDMLEGEFERDAGGNLANYDVDARGRFLIMLKSAAGARDLRMVRNWGTELAQLARSR